MHINKRLGKLANGIMRKRSWQGRETAYSVLWMFTRGTFLSFEADLGYDELFASCLRAEASRQR